MLAARIVAFCIDLLLVILLCYLPRFGVYVAVGYFIMRDTVVMNFQSVGKSLCQLKVKERGDKSNNFTNSKKAMMRNIMLVTPIIFVDVYHLFKTGERLIDKWLSLTIVKVKQNEKKK